MASAHYLIVAALAILSARISNLQLLSPIFVSDLNKFKKRHPERAMLYEPILQLVENPTKYSAENEPMLPLVEKKPLGWKNSLILPERNSVEEEPMLPLVERDRPLLTEKEIMQPSWHKNLPLCCQKHRSLAQKLLLQQTPSLTLESLADNSRVASIVEQVRPMLSENNLMQPSWLKKLAQKQLLLQPQSINLESIADDSKAAPKLDVLIQYDDDDYDDDDFDDDSKRTVQIIEEESSEEANLLEPTEPEIFKRAVSIQSTVNVIPEKEQDEVLERLRTVCAQFSMNVQHFSKDEPVGARLIPGLVSALCKILLKETGYVVPEIQETNMYRHRPLESWD